MSDYKTLRTWALFLMVLGIVSVISAGIGVVSLAIAVDGFWDTMGVLFLGTPIALLLASWPLALGQRSAPSPTSATASLCRSRPTEFDRDDPLL